MACLSFREAIVSSEQPDRPERERLALAFRPPVHTARYLPTDQRPTPPAPMLDILPFEITVGNAAFLLDERPERIIRLIKDGVLKAERIGRRWCVKSDSVRQLYHMKRQFLQRAA
jgi:excisionase family DNA binding protein